MNFMNEGCHYFQQKREILVSYQQVTWFLSCVLLWFLKHLSLVKVMCYAGTAWTHSSSLSLSLSFFYRLIQRYVEWSLPLGVFKTLFRAS